MTRELIPAAFLLFTMLGLVGGALSSAAGAESPRWTVTGYGRMGVCVLKDGAPVFKLESQVFEDWRTHSQLEGVASVADGARRVLEEKDVVFREAWQDSHTSGLDLRCETARAGDDSVTIEHTLVSETPADYGMPWDGAFGVQQEEGRDVYGVAFYLLANSYFDRGSCRATFEDGSAETIPLLPPAKWGKTGVRELALRTADGETTRLEFAPAVMVHCDHGDMRLFVHQSADAGERVMQEITMTLPDETAFEPSNRWIDTSDWIEYENSDDFAPGSVMGLEDWLDRPAGAHGWLKVDDGRFVFADGTPVKFFGTNISWDDMACPRDQADQWNDRWAKYGVNLVRLHKFINPAHAGIMTQEDQMVPDPQDIELFDYYHASARKRGIYLGWSPVFHMRVSPADRDRVRHYDEIMAAGGRGDVYGLKNIAPDIQDLLIARVVMPLERRNTETGIRYADDPALAYIELHNEDDIFFDPNNFERLRRSYPTYYREFQHRFNDFLKDKYGSQEALEPAWGESYPDGQKLSDKSLRTYYPWWEVKGRLSPRILDSLRFMYETQHEFYARYVEAIRDTGYGGAICGSCWQGWGWHGHLLNLLTDYEVGFIDRHNYAPTILNRPGVGCISVGFQQEGNRPFNFSEWGGGPVGVPTIALYGLGLQGWDASCQFSSKIPGIYNRPQRSVNGNCDDFIQVGQWPALARCVYRGDVKEGAIVANRRVSIPGLMAGEVGFSEEFALLGGGANNKEFSSVVPKEALAAGRVTLEFIDGPVPEEPIVRNVTPYIDRDAKRIRSTTGQLVWQYSGRGFYSVNTPGTQAVIGYPGGEPIALDDVEIVCPQDTELKVYVTALDETDSIATADRLLVTAFGRDAGTGAVFDEFTERRLVQGGEPLLLEPVRATITVKGGGVKAVRPLDHAGRPRPRAAGLKVRSSDKGDSFTIDGSESRTMYYVVER